MLIGLDLWGTLLKQNPLFLEKKKQLFREFLPEVPVEKVLETFLKVKEVLNNYIEISGDQPSREHIYLSIKNLLSEYKIPYERIKLLMEIYNKYAVLYPPLYIDGAKEFLSELDNNGIQYIIISNTMFITGKVIIKNFSELEKHRVAIFSDILGKAKPYPLTNPILDAHIGDNNTTDRLFAENVGAKFLRFTGNNYKEILDELKKLL